MKAPFSLFSILLVALVLILPNSCTDVIDEDPPMNDPNLEGFVMQSLRISFDDAIEVFEAGAGEQNSKIMSLPGVEDLVVQINVYDFWGYDYGWGPNGEDGTYGNADYLRTAFYEYTYLLENPEIVVPMDPTIEVSVEVQARLILSEEQVVMLREEGYEIEEVEVFNSFTPPPDTDPVKIVYLLSLWQWTPPFFTDPAYSTTFFGAWSDMFMPDPGHPMDIDIHEVWGPQAFSFEVLNSNTGVDIPGEISIAFVGGWEEAYWEENMNELPDYMYTNDYIFWIKLLYTSPSGQRYLLAAEDFEEYAWKRLVLFHLKLNVPELEFDDEGELTNFSTNSRTFYIELPSELWHEEVVEIGG